MGGGGGGFTFCEYPQCTQKLLKARDHVCIKFGLYGAV